MEIAIVVIENKLEEALAKSDWEFLAQSIQPIARCVAMASLGTKERIEKETDKLTDKLLWKIPAANLVEMFRVVAVQNRVSDFTTITRFLCHQATTMMTPNPGHE